MYAKTAVYLVYFDVKLRDMQSDLRELEGDSIDFTNIGRGFLRTDDEWVRKATQHRNQNIYILVVFSVY